MAKHLIRSTAWHRKCLHQINLRNSHEITINLLYPNSSKLQDNSVSHVRRRPMCTSSLPSSWFHKYQIVQKSVLDGDTDIECTVSVIDTHRGATDKPIVFGVHGLPGQGDDFEPLISQLHKRGVRVVAPTFPGFEGSLLETWQLNHFDFTTQGRARVVKTLLDTMDIHRVDMLLSHSAGAWVSYKVLAEWDMFKSAGLLSPVGARPHRVIRPHFIIKVLSALLRVEAGHSVALPLLSRIYNSVGFSGIKTGTHLVAAQHMVAGPQFHNVASHAQQIRRKKVPLFIAHSLSDKLLEWEIPFEVISKHLHIPQQNIVQYPDNSVAFKDALPACVDDWMVRVLLFERGGHIVHKPHCDIIVDQVLSILQHLNPASS
ncbi:uncharacterized protein [Haliotis cracherodii]|uniref:uncharacterized protein n=1 Tax=Haliotis cracherodii TaxID=6455 RepID=UPI0039E83ADF